MAQEYTNYDNQEDTEKEKEGNEPKIHSLWLKPSSWKKLSITKEGIGLTWNQTLELLIEQAIQANIIPEEHIERIREIDIETGSELPNADLWRETFGIGLQWPKNAETLKKLREESEKLNIALDELITTIEDHADAVIASDRDLKE